MSRVGESGTVYGRGRKPGAGVSVSDVSGGNGAAADY